MGLEKGGLALSPINGGLGFLWSYNLIRPIKFLSSWSDIIPTSDKIPSIPVGIPTSDN